MRANYIGSCVIIQSKIWLTAAFPPNSSSILICYVSFLAWMALKLSTLFFAHMEEAVVRCITVGHHDQRKQNNYFFCS